MTEQIEMIEPTQTSAVLMSMLVGDAIELGIDDLEMIRLVDDEDFDLTETGMNRDCVYTAYMGPSEEGAENCVDIFWFYNWIAAEITDDTSEDWWTPIIVTWTGGENDKFTVYQDYDSSLLPEGLKEEFIDLCFSLGENLLALDEEI